MPRSNRRFYPAFPNDRESQNVNGNSNYEIRCDYDSPDDTVDYEMEQEEEENESESDEQVCGESSIRQLIESASDEVLTTVGAACYAKSTDSDFQRYLASHSRDVRTKSEFLLNNNCSQINKHFICNKCGSELRRSEKCCGNVITYYRVGGFDQLKDLVKQFTQQILETREKLKNGDEKYHNLTGKYLRKLWESEERNRLNLSIIGSIDGVSLEGNTRQKIWPVSFMLVDIPTAEMQRATSLVINGVAEGPENPGTYFWNKVVPMIYADVEGSHFNVNNYEINFTIVSWTCDQPAKRSLFGMKGHNSESSCFYGMCKGTFHKTLAPPRYTVRKGCLTDLDAANGTNGFGNIQPKILDYLYPYETIVDILHNGSEGIFSTIMSETLSSSVDRRSDTFLTDTTDYRALCNSSRVPPEFTVTDMSSGSEKLTYFRINFGLAALVSEKLTPLARLSIVSLMLLSNQMYSSVPVSNIFTVHLTAVARWSLSSSSPRYMTTKAHELVSHLPYTTEMFGNNAPLSTFSFEHLYKHFLKGYNPQLTKGFVEKTIKRLITSTAVRRELALRARAPQTATLINFINATPDLKQFRISWKGRITALQNIDDVDSLKSYEKFSSLQLPCGRLQSKYSSPVTQSDIFFAENSAAVHGCYRFISVCVSGENSKILAERIRSLCSTEEFPLITNDAENLNAPGNTYAYNLLRHLKSYPGLVHGRLSGDREIIEIEEVKGIGACISNNSVSYYLQLNGGFVHH